MRKLMWIALGLALMCAATAYFSGLAVICIGLVAVIVGITALIIGKTYVRARILGLICVGLVIGWSVCGLYDVTTLSKARSLDERDIHLSAQATDYSFQTDYGSAVTVKAEIDGKKFSSQLYFNNYFDLKPGDRVEGTFRMDFTGGEDGTFHFGNGIVLLGYQSGNIYISESDGVPLFMMSAVWRRDIVNTIDSCFDGDNAAFAKALLLGDRTDVGYELNNAFKVTGISHIIAVSGMHVSILASVIYLLAAKKRWLMALLGVPAVLLFAAVAGFTPSITRACVMQVLLLIALVLDRDYDPLTSLAVAAGIMLFSNPMVITSVSFQLSFGCMAGIFLFTSRVYRRMSDFGFWKDAKPKSLLMLIRRWFAGSVSATLGAMSFTVPLCAIHFGTVSLIGVVTNLIVIWLVSILFPCIILVCLLATVSMPLATALAGIVGLPMGWMLTFVRWLAKFPLCAAYTQSIFVVIWLIVGYGMFLLFLLMKRRETSAFAAACIIELCLALLLSWAVPRSCDVQLTVLDVGQGQCVLLTAKGRTFIIDCGGEYDESAADLAAETLLSHGIFRIDGLILTHFDRDHAGGAEYLLTRIPVDRVFLSPAGDIPKLRKGIEAAAGNRADYVHEDKILTWDGCSITIFAPVSANSDNESGISVLFSGENCDILITGDMNTLGETLLLSSREIPKLEALVVGHHGSKSSTSERLLEKTMPEIAIISVGEDNPYGHPAQTVLDRLKEYGCEIRRTDIEGTIIFRR